MDDQLAFITSVVDSVSDSIVVIDEQGCIVYVNKAWRDFAVANRARQVEWKGTNYLKVCQKAKAAGDTHGEVVFDGITSVIQHKANSFTHEYPCHSPCQKRWFIIKVNAFNHGQGRFIVICHQDITQRKLAEERLITLSRTDGLTGVANRQYFDEFYQREWLRCLEAQKPLCVAMIDLDHFKYLNDTYGHQTGDNALKAMGHALLSQVKRPCDLAARYGGEEFIVLLSNCELTKAETILNTLHTAVAELNFPNESSPIFPFLTISIGIAEMYPSDELMREELIYLADKMLYRAKDRGRNRTQRCTHKGGSNKGLSKKELSNPHLHSVK